MTSMATALEEGVVMTMMTMPSGGTAQVREIMRTKYSGARTMASSVLWCCLGSACC